MNRLNSEIEFHNRRFSEEVRQSAWKFYSIERTSRDYFYNSINESAVSKNILEIGCGKDLYAIKLAEKAKLIQAIDISGVAVKYSSQIVLDKRLQSKINYYVMNAEELDFPQNSIEFAFGSSIIHHLHIESFLKKLTMVLTTDGKASFLEPLNHNIFINLYRKLTPRMRTEDEHPLMLRDLKKLNDFFDEVDLKYFHLSTLLAVPFRNVSIFPGLLRMLEKFDRFLFSIPFFRKYAWQVIIELKKPIK